MTFAIENSTDIISSPITWYVEKLMCNGKYAYLHLHILYSLQKKFHREMRLRCPTCPKIYIDKRDFNLHAACCAKRKFRCDICSLKFKRKFTMECHKSLTHNRVIKPDKPFGILLEDTNINIKTELVLEGTTLQPQDVELRYPPRIMNGPRVSTIHQRPRLLFEKNGTENCI